MLTPSPHICAEMPPKLNGRHLLALSLISHPQVCVLDPMREKCQVCRATRHSPSDTFPILRVHGWGSCVSLAGLGTGRPLLAVFQPWQPRCPAPALGQHSGSRCIFTFLTSLQQVSKATEQQSVDRLWEHS